MTTVLVTGFAPFDGAEDNPSAAVVERLGAGWDRSERLEVAVLPVSFVGAARTLAALLDQHRPVAYVGVGLAAGRARPGLERFAVNLCDARIPDEDGDQPSDRAVQPGGPLARATSIPVKAALRRLQQAGVDVELSTTAGTFVCNAVFYAGAAWAGTDPARRAGFVHVPGHDVATSTRVVRVAVETALDVVVVDDRAVGALD